MAKKYATDEVVTPIQINDGDYCVVVRANGDVEHYSSLPTGWGCLEMFAGLSRVALEINTHICTWLEGAANPEKEDGPDA